MTKKIDMKDYQKPELTHIDDSAFDETGQGSSGSILVEVIMVTVMVEIIMVTIMVVVMVEVDLVSKKGHHNLTSTEYQNVHRT